MPHRQNRRSRARIPLLMRAVAVPVERLESRTLLSATPTAFTASATSPFSVALSWQEPAGSADSFTIQRSAAADFASIDRTVTVSAAATGYTDPVVDPSSVSYYRIVANGGGSASAPATTSAVTPAESWTPGAVVPADPNATWSSPGFLTAFHHQMFFVGHLYDGIGFNVYRTDGSGSSEIYDGPVTSFGLSPDGKSLSFSYISYNKPTLYFVSDGTAEGTVQLSAPPAPPPPPPPPAFPVGSVVIGNKAFSDGVAPDGSRQLFVTDGTATGTVQLTFIRKDLTAGTLAPYALTAFNGLLYFYAQVADTSDSGSLTGLWRSDGTRAGTWPVKSLPNHYSQFNTITGVNGKVFFNDAQSLWSSDGTSAGTSELLDFGPSYVPAIQDVTVLDHQLYFTSHQVVASDTNGNPEYDGKLWTSDGTAAGTTSIAGLPLTTLVDSASPSQLLDVDGNLWFAADVAKYDTTLFHYYPPAPPLAPPAAPTGLGSSLVFGSEIDLNWADRSDDEAGFRLQRSSTASFATIDESVDLSMDATSYADAGLTPGQAYYYRVASFNDGGVSAFDPAGPFTTPHSPPPVGGLAAAADGPSHTVTLTWTDRSTSSDGETSVLVQRSSREDFSTLDFSQSLPPGSGAYVDSTATGLMTYWYRVLTVNSSGESGPQVVTFSTPEFAPAAAPIVVASAVSGTEVDLQWTEGSSDVNGFVVERAGADGVFSQIGTTTGSVTTFADKSAQPDTDYTYRVRAENTVGSSPNSNVVTTTTLPPELATPVLALPPLVPVTGGAQSNPSAVQVLNGIGFFTAVVQSSPDAGQLWRTDGTRQGSSLIMSFTGQSLSLLAGAGNEMYFAVEDGATGGTALWKSDGTAAGTVKVTDLSAVIVNTSGANPYLGSALGFNGKLFFAELHARGGGGTLYVTDGTAAGTVPLRDFTGGGIGSPGGFAVANGKFFFEAETEYQSDGTPEGTVPSTDFVPGLGQPRVQNGSFTFYTDGTSIFRSDGTSAGTMLVATPPSDGSGPQLLTAVSNGIAYVTNTFNADRTIEYHTLWYTDGTPAGTVQLVTLTYGGVFGITDLAGVGNTLYFTIGNGGGELWTSNLTAAGTTRLAALSSFIDHMAAVGPLLTFRGGGDATQLWASDGTVGGTQQITDIGETTQPAHPDWITTVGGLTYFVASSYAGGLGTGQQLWRSDGTAGGTYAIYTGPVKSLYNFNGTLAFVSADTLGNPAIFETDGSTAGTRPIYSVPPSASPYTLPAILSSAGKFLYFSLSDINTGTSHLWETDGTSAGTRQVTADGVNAFVDVYDQRTPFAAVGSLFYFSGASGALYRTEGTQTVAVPGITSGIESMCDVNGTLYVVGGPNETLYDLAPGSTTPTKLADPFPTMFSLGVVDDLTAVGNELYFTAETPTSGVALWKSDGTAAGTVQVFDPFGYSADASVQGRPYGITDVNGTAYFLVSDEWNSGPFGGQGALYKTDGTAAGTTRIRSVQIPYAQNGGADQPLYQAAVNGYYVYSDSQAVWRSDGTNAGTVQIDQIGTASDGNASMASFNGAAFAVSGNNLYYAGPAPGGAGELRIASLQLPAAPTGLTSVAQPPVSPAAVRPAAVTIRGAAGPATTPVRLNWSEQSTNQSGFVVERSLRADFATIDRRFFVPGKVTTYTDGSAVTGTNYYYRVRAVDAGGGSGYSNVSSVAGPVPVAPGAPAALKATAVTTTSVTLVWTASTGSVTAYHVERSLDGVRFAEVAGGLTGASYTDTSLNAGARYYYRVRAENAGAFSPYGNVVSVGTAGFATSLLSPSAAPAAAGQNVQDSGITLHGGVDLGLKFRSDASGYVTGVRFWKGSRNTGVHTGQLWSATGQLLATATFTNETTSGWQQVNFSNPVAIAAGATYVVAYHTAAAYVAYTGGAFSATGIDNGQLHAPASGTAGGNGVYHYDNVANTPAFPSQSNGQAPSYWVDVVFAAALPTAPSAPANVAAAATSATQVRVQWTASAGNVTAYHVERSTDGINFTEIAGGVTGTSCADATAQPSTRYTYRVRAENAGRFSAYAVAPPVTTPAAAQVSTLWSASSSPAASQQNVNDPQIAAHGGIELGLKFRSDVAGYVTGVRFWKGSRNTGPHTGQLWSSTGQLLATATFTNESASGWQQVTFTSPVAIAANTTYVVSYHTTAPYIAYTGNTFTTGIDRGPLHALSSGSSAGNGIFAFDSTPGAGRFPNTFNGASPNYWVDVVFGTQPTPQA